MVSSTTSLKTCEVTDPMLTGLNHLTLAVSDLPRSLAFYRDVLNLRVEATWDAGA